MILSGRDIQWYIDQKKLVVSPVEPIQFQQNGIDLYLESWEFPNEKGFCLGVSREWIEVPDDLMAFVEIRSTWGRRGFLLPPTIVDAGFKGHLTFEILWVGDTGPRPVGERFVHLIFAKLTSPSEPYKGKYQFQKGITKAISDGAR